MINVVWEKSALDRHEEWAFSISQEYTMTHALTYLADIESAVSNIAHHPFIGTEFKKSTDRKNVRCLVTPIGYSVYYELDSSNEPTQAVIFSVLRSHRS
ncbi:MAG: type II toxin-antitoxin system RelE/ParE family toxin [Pseudobdellovibrio sp.]|nr:type II toxin-antitoxin system RelE/ParE family toxin [Pseudobdellovibrio sp.]